MGTEASSLMSSADPVTLVRRWEAEQQRVLVDPSLAAWEDLDSEVVLLARQHWRVPLPTGAAYWSRRRYLSFNRRGVSERLIEVQLLGATNGALRMRYGDLLTAGVLGRRYWIYALTVTPHGQVALSTYRDPASLAWSPAGAGGVSGGEPMWIMPMQCGEVHSTILDAA